MERKHYKLQVVSNYKDNEYYTPIGIIHKFGNFEYDPSTTDLRAKKAEIPHFDTIETNGLMADWKYKRVWVNPPFTLKKEFMEKAIKEYIKYRNEIYILLPIEFITTKKFHSTIGKHKFILFLPNGRINFEKEDGVKKGCWFGSIIIKLDDRLKENVIKMIDL